MLCHIDECIDWFFPPNVKPEHHDQLPHFVHMHLPSSLSLVTLLHFHFKVSQSGKFVILISEKLLFFSQCIFQYNYK